MGIHAISKTNVKSLLCIYVLMLDSFSIVHVDMEMKILIRFFLNQLINFLLHLEDVLYNLNGIIILFNEIHPTL